MIDNARCPVCGHDPGSALPNDARLDGLSVRELQCLDRLRAYGPLSALALRRQIGSRHIGYTLTKLTRRGLIEKVRVPDDPRNPVYRAVALEDVR